MQMQFTEKVKDLHLVHTQTVLKPSAILTWGPDALGNIIIGCDALPQHIVLYHQHLYAQSSS